MKKIMLVIIISFAFGQSGEEIKSKTAFEWNKITDKFEQSQGQNYGSFACGQIIESEVMSEEEWYFSMGSVPVVETKIEMPFELEPIKIWHFLKYAEECYTDTIRLEKFGDEEYLLMHEYYGEIFTERQLNKQGYYYSYRWITNTVIDEDNLMEFEYIFIGKPTLEGFIEWFANRSK